MLEVQDRPWSSSGHCRPCVDNLARLGILSILDTLKPQMFIGNEIVDHSDVVEASPVGAGPTTSVFSI